MSFPESFLAFILLTNDYKSNILLAYEIRVPGMPQVIEVHKNVTAVAFGGHKALIL